MEGAGEFLSRTEILDIFKRAGAGAEGKKGKAEAAAGSTLPKAVGQRVWVKNAEHNEADQENKEKPFYQAKVLADNGATCSLQLWDGEVCAEAKFLGEFQSE